MINNYTELISWYVLFNKNCSKYFQNVMHFNNHEFIIYLYRFWKKYIRKYTKLLIKIRNLLCGTFLNMPLHIKACQNSQQMQVNRCHLEAFPDHKQNVIINTAECYEVHSAQQENPLRVNLTQIKNVLPINQWYKLIHESSFRYIKRTKLT